MKMMMPRVARITTPVNAKKPGARNSFWNSSICPTVSSFGPFRAMTTEPTYRWYKQQ